MKSVNKVLTLILISFTFLCQAQKLDIINKKITEHIESEKLTEYITSELKIDTSVKMQSATIFINVNSKGKVTFLNISGDLDKQNKKRLEDKIRSPLAPWINKNKKNALWYVLPLFFGQIQEKYSTEEIKWLMLYFENNLNSLRELEIDNPGNVVILRTYSHLTNKGMYNFYD